MSSTYLLFAISGILLGLACSYPTGAPQETCQTFSANHGENKPQASRAKYQLIASPSNVAAGGTITVTLQGMGSEKFKGFFIQGQDSNGNPVGKFMRQPDAQTRDCSGAGSADAATHVNADDKNKVSIKWQAPADFAGSVAFRAVVVKNYETFWNNIVSNQLTVA